VSGVIVEAHARKQGGATRVDHVVELAPGLRYLVRPVSPDDEPAMVRLLERMTTDEVRMRFFCCMRHFGHALVSCMVQPDDAQRIGLVAVPEYTAADNIVADGMLISEPDGQRAEFAILVHRDHAQHGLGRHLIECLIAQGRARGVRQVYGIVLADNHKMLVLATEMGFVTRANPDDRATVRVELDLA